MNDGRYLAALLFTVMLALTWRDAAGEDRASIRPTVIGIVQLTEVDIATFEGFKAGMMDVGQRIAYDYPGPAGSTENLPALIDAMLARGVDAILVSSTPATRAVVAATRQRPLPVVFAPVNDPVAAGVVANLHRPGGQVTGVRLPLGDDLRLGWLTRMLPAARNIFIPYVASDKSSTDTVTQASIAAPTLGLSLTKQAVDSCNDVSNALTMMPRSIDAIFLPRDSLVESCIDAIVAGAKARQVPVIAPSLTQVNRGALLSYGFVHREIGRQAARQMQQILRGISPGDLPVEMAESYLALNLAAAAAIGLAITDDTLVLANTVKRD